VLDVKLKKLTDLILQQAHKTREVQKELAALEATRAELLAGRRELIRRALDEQCRPVEPQRFLGISHAANTTEKIAGVPQLRTHAV
jgi:hypothetical protein